MEYRFVLWPGLGESLRQVDLALRTSAEKTAWVIYLAQAVIQTGPTSQAEQIVLKKGI
jgi:hypothetical protein